MINKYKFEFFLFVFFGKLFTFFGFESIHKTAKLLAIIAFHIFRIRRRVVLKNLSLAFPELDSKQIKLLAIKNYQSVAITFLEVFNLTRMDRENIKINFLSTGLDFVHKKYQGKKGLILLTAHFGNWELGAVAVGLHLDETIHVLVKKQKNPYVAKWLNNFRERFGNKQIPLGVSVRELYSTIKEQKIVGIVGDQRGTKDGVKVNFFGIKTSTFPGTASIALKTQCPVVVLLCARQKNGIYKSEIEEIRLYDIVGTQEERIREFNQRYMAILEKNIKKYPEQWFWMHNIWKHHKKEVNE